MKRRRPRVLVAIKGLGVGGAERLVSEGSRLWNRDAFDYRVAYVLPWKDQLVAELAASNLEVTCLGGRRGGMAGAARRLRRLIAAEKIDLVHAHLPAMGVAARMASPVPVVYTEHNVAESYRRLTRWANRATYGRNAATIAVSDAVAESVRGYPGPERVVIPNGVACRVEPAAAARARAELDLDAADPLVVHVGNIRPGKGHENLIAAAALLRRHHPQAAVVSIGVEKHAGDLERLRAATRAAGAADTLRFLGRRVDATAFIKAADVFVNPSEVEGLPIVVLEAMTLGTPVVATSAGGVPSVVYDGKTGILVEPQDPEALARGMAELLQDRARAQRLAAGAAELVEQEHSLESMVRGHEAVYREVLDV